MHNKKNKIVLKIMSNDYSCSKQIGTIGLFKFSTYFQQNVLEWWNKTNKYINKYIIHQLNWFITSLNKEQCSREI